MRLIFIGMLTLALSGCGLFQSPKQEFWGRLHALCGKSFAGSLVSDDPQDAKFREADLSVQFGGCSDDDQLDMDFMVDGKPYAHWWITRTGNRFEFRHVHDEGVTGYGGFAADNSSGSRMNFPADEYSKMEFLDAGLEDSVQNVWALEVRSGSVFNYEMSRPGRYFMVSFDITNPITDFASTEN